MGSSFWSPSVEPWQANLEETGANRALPGDEGRASCRAALLRVVVGEDRAFVGDPVDVGRLVAHHPQVVSADVEVTYVVTKDHKDVGLLLLLCIAERRIQD